MKKPYGKEIKDRNTIPKPVVKEGTKTKSKNK